MLDNKRINRRQFIVRSPPKELREIARQEE
jgi:hypothetical protein